MTAPELRALTLGVARAEATEIGDRLEALEQDLRSAGAYELAREIKTARERVFHVRVTLEERGC